MLIVSYLVVALNDPTPAVIPSSVDFLLLYLASTACVFHLFPVLREIVFERHIIIQHIVPVNP